MDPGDPKLVKGGSDIVGERRHRIVAGHRVAAAVPAHVEAQHPEPGLQQRRHLFGPHAAVGSQGVGDADDRPILGTDQIVVEAASCERQQHGTFSVSEGGEAIGPGYHGSIMGSPVMIG